MLDRKGNPQGVITAAHCVAPDAVYRVVYQHDKEILLQGKHFKRFGGDIIYAPIATDWVPQFAEIKRFVSGSVEIYHSALGRTVRLTGEVLFVGRVEELRIGEMLYWLDKTDRIMLVKAISFSGCSGSPVYYKGKRIGVVSGGGQGMTIVALGG